MKTIPCIFAMFLAAAGAAFAPGAFAADEAPAGPVQAPPAAPAQAPPAGPVPSQPPQYRSWPGYDLNTVVTITGEVVKVDRVQRRGGMFSAVHLVVETHGGETIDVLLGPSYFVDKQPVRIGEKDKIEITGSRGTTDKGKPFIIAASIRKGEEVLKLREADGTPLWRRKKSC